MLNYVILLVLFLNLLKNILNIIIGVMYDIEGVRMIFYISKVGLAKVESK